MIGTNGRAFGQIALVNQQGQAPPRLRPVESPPAVDGDITEVTWGPEDEPTHKLHLLDWAELFGREPPEQEWTVPNIVPEGKQVAIYGQAGSGKSLLLLEASAAIASGRSLYEEQASDPRHVVYLDQEMTPDDVQERMEAFGYGPDNAADLQRYFHYFQMQSIAPLDTERGGQMLMDIVHAFQADLIVIDTMTMLVQGDEQSSNTYRDFDRYVSVPLKHEERSLVRLDHMGKNGDMRGSSHKAGYVDLVWKLEKKHDLTLTCRKSRLSVVKYGEKLTFTIREDPLRHVFQIDNVIDHQVEDTITLLEAAGIPADAPLAKAARDIHKRKDLVGKAQKERKARLRDPKHHAVVV
jgi:ABC-type dipeptide/oligopeptide/nickel transport system ATPase component